MKFYVDQLAAACGYDPDEDGPVDALIAYKDVLEERLRGVEVALRHNALGHISCADLAGSLWASGLDPNDYMTPVGPPEPVR